MLPSASRRGLRTSLVVSVLGLTALLGPAAHAKQTICCRSSGGTRGTCLNLWAHLVPTSNRFAPGPSRRIALLLGPSDSATAMTVQLFRATGEPLAEQTLPALRAGVWLLTLPGAQLLPRQQPVLWESFPTCQPNKPPTRTYLVPETLTDSSTIQAHLAALGASCGKEVTTAALLRDFGLEDYSARLPPSLPVHCRAIRADSGGAQASPGNGSRP